MGKRISSKDSHFYHSFWKKDRSGRAKRAQREKKAVWIQKDIRMGESFLSLPASKICSILREQRLNFWPYKSSPVLYCKASGWETYVAFGPVDPSLFSQDVFAISCSRAARPRFFGSLIWSISIFVISHRTQYAHVNWEIDMRPWSSRSSNHQSNPGLLFFSFMQRFTEKFLLWQMCFSHASEIFREMEREKMRKRPHECYFAQSGKHVYRYSLKPAIPFSSTSVWMVIAK